MIVLFLFVYVDLRFWEFVWFVLDYRIGFWEFDIWFIGKWFVFLCMVVVVVFNFCIWEFWVGVVCRYGVFGLIVCLCFCRVWRGWWFGSCRVLMCCVVFRGCCWIVVVGCMVRCCVCVRWFDVLSVFVGVFWLLMWWVVFWVLWGLLLLLWGFCWVWLFWGFCFWFWLWGWGWLLLEGLLLLCLIFFWFFVIFGSCGGCRRLWLFVRIRCVRFWVVLSFFVVGRVVGIVSCFSVGGMFLLFCIILFILLFFLVYVVFLFLGGLRGLLKLVRLCWGLRFRNW